MDKREAAADGFVLGTSRDEEQERNGLSNMGVDRSGRYCGDRSGWGGNLGVGLERDSIIKDKKQERRKQNMEKNKLNIPSFRSYGDYENSNYGAHSLMFTDNKGQKFYFSYRTLVAFYSNKTGLVCIRNYWGTTTGKHLNWIEADKNKRVDQETFDKLLEELD